MAEWGRERTEHKIALQNGRQLLQRSLCIALEELKQVARVLLRRLLLNRPAARTLFG